MTLPPGYSLRHPGATHREFWRRGERGLVLGVDAENPTGATRLYQRAGMQVAFEFVACEKQLGL